MFNLIKTKKTGVRVGKLTTPHGVIDTPFFMPVGTVGSVKGVSSEELQELGAEIVLANTYHLYLRPGEKLIKKIGGLHKFMNWQKPILTDSGGYQVFSLGSKKESSLRGAPANSGATRQSGIDRHAFQTRDDNQSLMRICDEGVVFSSHLDGSKHLFTPEKVIEIQLDLGVDILMPLDVCPNGKASYDEVKKACVLTVEWAKRSKKYFDKQMAKRKITNDELLISNKKTNKKMTKLGIRRLEVSSTLGIRNSKLSSDALRPMLHGIVQGGLYPDLRIDCAKKLVDLDFDGYSVGGLAVDLETRDMWDIVKLMGEILPENKARYLMGVGTPDDIIKATKLGMDMFDCVLPTRLGRHGSVYIKTVNGNPPTGEAGEARIGNVEWSRDRQTPDDTSIITCLPVRQADKPSTINEYELVNLLKAKYRTDSNVIDEQCKCPACRAPINSKNRERGYSRAYISHLLKSREILGIRLTTLHNLYTYLDLMRNIQK